MNDLSGVDFLDGFAVLRAESGDLDLEIKLGNALLVYLLVKLGLVALLLFKEDTEFLVEELDGLELAVGFRFG